MNAARSFPSKSELEALMRENNVPGLPFVVIENAVRATFDWDLELDNSDKLTALEIVRAFTSISLVQEE